MLTGLFLIVARRKAITQALGFVAMENGVYLFGIAFAVHGPWLVQAGVMLDVFAADFIMGIMIVISTGNSIVSIQTVCRS